LERTVPDAVAHHDPYQGRELIAKLRVRYVQTVRCAGFFQTISPQPGGLKCGVDSAALDAIRQFEKLHDVLVPESLVYFYSRCDIAEMVTHC
jgi:hypothetical protein